MASEEASVWIGSQQDAMVDLQRELTARPAIGPDNDGDGEWEKARFLEDYLRRHGIDQIEHLDCPDDRVPEGSRPNFIATIPGLREEPAVWVLTHLDVVPPGEKAADGTWKGWDTDPFCVQRVGEMIVGRGVSDNQQSIVSSIFGVLALLENDIRPAHTVRLLFVSDEETGSAYGLEHLLEEYADRFPKNDAYIVPDAGNEDGSMVEIAEKSVLWLEFRVQGKQAHGSRPDRGINAFRAASRLVYLLDTALSDRFDKVDHLYEPPSSTFEPTLHKANVPNVNTIPGEDVFCFDCRVLPDYKLDSVLDSVRAECRSVDASSGTETEVIVRNRMDAPRATPSDASAVRLLCTAVERVLGVAPQTMGVGGMTVASMFRSRGLPAAVWMTSSGTEHQTNERCPIASMVGDARVFAEVFQTEF
ncbi:MAG: M20 family metallo-hydrolase [Planctomycetota bacterium]